MLGDPLGYLYRLEIDGTEDTELCISYEILIGITLGTYGGIELGLSYSFSCVLEV